MDSEAQELNPVQVLEGLLDQAFGQENCRQSVIYHESPRMTRAMPKVQVNLSFVFPVYRFKNNVEIQRYVESTLCEHFKVWGMDCTYQDIKGAPHTVVKVTLFRMQDIATVIDVLQTALREKYTNHFDKDLERVLDEATTNPKVR